MDRFRYKQVRLRVAVREKMSDRVNVMVLKWFMDAERMIAESLT